MKDFTVKKAVLNGIGALAGLMMLLALCVPLVTGTRSDSIFGYEFFEGVSDCGFTLFDFSSPLITSSFQWGAVLMGLLGYLQLFGAIAVMALNVVSLCCFSRKVGGMVAMLSVFVAVGSCLFYMIEGIVYMAICCSTYYSVSVVTLAYLPFIFSIMIITAFFVCKFAVKESAAEQIAAAGNTLCLWEFPEDSDLNPISPERADALIMNFKNFIPEESYLRFRDALTHVAEEKYSQVAMTPVKDPTTVLLLSVFLGGLGVDRFYIGDTELGIVKLLLGGLTMGIWPIVDIFFCYKRAKERNLEALLRSMHG